MKSILFFICCTVLFCDNTLAQQGDFICGMPDEIVQDPVGVYSYSNDTNVLNDFEPVVFNIFFWGINKSDGTPGISSLTEYECLTSVSQLNRVYNDFNIFFKYVGYDNTSFNSDEYYHLTKWECLDGNPDNVFEFAAESGFVEPHSFNVYVASGGADFSGYAQNYFKVNIATNHVFTDHFEGMIAHEVGHCLNLQHTHSAWDTNYCEHVTRDIQSNDYNALNNGDHLHETPAMPDFRNEHLVELLLDGVPYEVAIDSFIPYKYVNPVTFQYNNPNGDDCVQPVNVPYDIDELDVRNYMAYNPASPEAFFETFTTDQKIRMREAIIEDEYGLFSDSETTVSSLYEPYKGEYYVAGPEPDPHTQPLFQPGFDYIFLACSCENQDGYDCVNGPCDFDENGFQSYTIIVKTVDKDETDYNSITLPNHSSIYIAQLNDIGNRRCYDNFNKSASFGTVTKFNDGVFNTNVTVMPQDSTQINNANLIEDLNPGLYVIDKAYQDGSNSQSVILKENN